MKVRLAALALLLAGCRRSCQSTNLAGRPLDAGSRATAGTGGPAYPDVDSGEGPGGIAIVRPAPNIWLVDSGVAEGAPRVPKQWINIVRGHEDGGGGEDQFMLMHDESADAAADAGGHDDSL